jgi:predicted permease
METLIAVISIYLFIVIGLIAKRFFGETLHEKTLVIISIYFLQPILTFWAIMQRPFDQSLLLTPVLYLLIVVGFFSILFFVIKASIDNGATRAVVLNGALIGNTGNLGIPLGIALLGEASVAYTSMINIANIFYVYIIGVYLFSRGSFSVKESLLNVVKLPIMWAALLAITLNNLGVSLNAHIEQSLRMGAYASLVLQLLLFGIYLYGAKLKEITYSVVMTVVSIKLVLLPLVGLAVLILLDIEPWIAMIVLFQLVTPIAVNNVNLAALYDSHTNMMASLVLITSLLFLGLIYFEMIWIKSYFG